MHLFVHTVVGRVKLPGKGGDNGGPGVGHFGEFWELGVICFSQNHVKVGS